MEEDSDNEEEEESQVLPKMWHWSLVLNDDKELFLHSDNPKPFKGSEARKS